MRRAGLSRGKMAYIRDLARHVRDGSLNFRRLAGMEDEEIITDLVRVRGIGQWTAEMFLMFNLRRPDVLPVDDLGFRTAVAKAFGLSQLPTAKELKLMGERWRPFRSAAVWYFWQSSRLITLDSTAKAAPKIRQTERKTEPRRELRVTNRLRPIQTTGPKANRLVARRAHRLSKVKRVAFMQAAFISYAVFLALLLIAVVVVFIIVGVRALHALIRGPTRKPRHQRRTAAAHLMCATSRQNDTAKMSTE